MRGRPRERPGEAVIFARRIARNAAFDFKNRRPASYSGLFFFGATIARQAGLR